MTKNSFTRCIWGWLVASALSPAALALTTDLATVPLITSAAQTVKPNLMFIFDDSGSMGWTYISSTAVRDWCIEKKVGMRDLLDDCKNAGVLIPPYRSRPNNFTIQVDLFKGTKEESAVVSRCIKVNTRQLRAMTGSDWDDTAGVANVLPLSPKAKPTGPADPEVEGASAV